MGGHVITRIMVRIEPKLDGTHGRTYTPVSDVNRRRAHLSNATNITPWMCNNGCRAFSSGMSLIAQISIDCTAHAHVLKSERSKA
jgi:hypothetical protein